MQFFNVPAKASHLYLGFVDGDNSGLIGFYEDNLGELSVNYEIRNSWDYQHKFEPQPSSSVNTGKILHYTFDDQIYINPDTTSEQSRIFDSLGDTSGFGFHGILSDPDNAEFSYQDAKYNMAVKMREDAAIKIVHPLQFRLLHGISGVPIGGSWSIATWFKYDAEHPNFSIKPAQLSCHWPGCRTGPHIFADASNNYELSTTETHKPGNTDLLFSVRFVGSGFYMTDLEAGWHHLVVIGTEGKTRFYIDGEFVGQTATQLTSNIEYIQAWMLDDFRIYNRVLSPSEISVLAEKSTEPPVVTPSPNQCITSYSSDGNLHIPCLSLPENYDTTRLYDIQLNQYPRGFVFELDVNSIKPSKFQQ